MTLSVSRSWRELVYKEPWLLPFLHAIARMRIRAKAGDLAST